MGGPAAEVSQEVAALGGDIDAVLGQVQVAAGVADRDGIIRWQNARAIELFGDCTGKPLATMVAPESSHNWRRQFSKKVIGSTKTTDYRMNMITPDGRHVPIEVSSIAIEGSDHKVVGVFGVLQPAAEPFKPLPRARHSLTPRQLEVLHHLAQGHSTAQIAEMLAIQPETVRNHVRGLLRALGVHSRLQAVSEARRRGLLAD
ncbi:MAG: LuxR C-terminal-related transcriptional regulator [Gaiellaceae bacterium]